MKNLLKWDFLGFTIPKNRWDWGKLCSFGLIAREIERVGFRLPFAKSVQSKSGMYPKIRLWHGRTAQKILAKTGKSRADRMFWTY
ncbi:MAG: hypothetical protein CM1200mP30_08650 [Pseudomonadota bacterium]|nr:MAG: hypothetical protein CM1200mP30_08650 [Pseudomonadota bacterium]